MSGGLEHRRFGGQCRVVDGRVEGVLLPWETRAKDRDELFRRGALDPLPADIPVNLQHDASLEVARATLTDTPQALLLSAPLARGSGAHSLVQLGALRSASVEFRALEEHEEGGTRVITRAELHGAGLVHEGAYDAPVEARRGRRRVRGSFPEKRTLSCECTDHLCDRVEFEEGTVRRALDRVFAAGSKVAAFLRNYDHPLASVRKKTIRRTDAWGVELLLDAETFEPVRQATGVLGAGGLLLRPFLDAARSVFTRHEGRADGAGAVAVYSDVAIRAFILSPADPANSGGWPPVEVSESASLDPAPAQDPRIAAGRRRRRVRL